MSGLVGSRQARDVGTADDQALAAQWAADGIEAALRVRAPAVHATTAMVRELAVRVARELQLDDDPVPIDLCARLRDVGMLALPDAIALSTGALSSADWEVLNTHPGVGAEMLEALEPLAAAAPVVRSHHERWDGDGYPDGLRGEAIPAASRVISVCDAFVSMARDRPHRRGLGIEVALERVVEEGGRQFDPAAVAALVAVIAGKSEAPAKAESRFQRKPEQRDLTSVLAELDVIPISALAHER